MTDASMAIGCQIQFLYDAYIYFIAHRFNVSRKKQFHFFFATFIFSLCSIMTFYKCKRSFRNVYKYRKKENNIEMIEKVDF